MKEQKTLNHIGFIMDGNRRWAKKLSNVVSFGHAIGGDNVEKILSLALSEGIPYVSMWALSKENILERDRSEITSIFELLEQKVPKLIPKLIEQSIRFEVVWDLWLVPPSSRTILLDATEATKTWKKMVFVLAVGYSGQDEIVRAVKRCMLEWIDPRTLTEKGFLDYLDTGKYPPPDLIVRTGGNRRHSGFFLYQSAYSEYYFTDTLWPDFGWEDFARALEFFYSAKRNFWK